MSKVKITPIKTKEDYQNFSKYLDSLWNVELDEEQTNDILIIQQLLEHYEQNNLTKVKDDTLENTENLDYIWSLIENVSSLEKWGLIERVCKLQEEVGELSAESLKSIGFKNSTLTYDQIKNNILLEGVDCLIMTIDILSQQGFKKGEIIEVADKQIQKWIESLN